MFTKKNDEKPATIQELIDGVATQMLTYDAHSDEYAKMNEQLQKLHKMKMTERPTLIPSADVVVQTLCSLIGIVSIVRFEQTHALTSKALGFVMKTK